MSSAPIKPPTVSEFDMSKVSIGNTREFAERGFVKHYINYNREDKLDSKSVVKLENVKVQGVYAPNEGNNKYGMLCVLNDSKQIELLTKLEQHIKDLALKNNKEWFDDAEMETDDIEACFKSMVKHNETYKNTSFTVSFPFMTEEVKDPVYLQYIQGCGEPSKEMLDSTDLTVKLPRGSIVDIFLQFTNILVQNSSKEFNIQRTVYKRINVRQLGASTPSNLLPRNGMEVSEIDVSKIVCGDVITNDRQGRSLKPKYKYTTQDGEEKLRSLSVFLPQVRVSFRRQIDDTGKSSFNVVYRLNEDHLEKFDEIDNYLKQDIFTNYKVYEGPGKKITKKMLDNKFKGAVKHSDDYPANMWYSVYAEFKDDVYDFKGNFLKPDGTRYTNEDILKDIFGNTYVCDLNVYLKHVWFVNAKGTYSAKFNVGSVVVDTTSTGTEYDLGDAYVDATTPTPTPTPTPTLTTSNDVVLDMQDDHVSSDPEDSSSVPSDED